MFFVAATDFPDATDCDEDVLCGGLKALAADPLLEARRLPPVPSSGSCEATAQQLESNGAAGQVHAIDLRRRAVEELAAAVQRLVPGFGIERRIVYQLYGFNQIRFATQHLPSPQ